MNTDSFINHIADKLDSFGLIMPTILLIEAHKPLAFVSSQLLLIAQPSLNLLLSPDNTQSLINLLSDDTHVDRLITALEQKAAHPST